MGIVVKPQKIDLYTFESTNRDRERLAIFAIQSQILGWLEKNDLVNKIKYAKSNSIIINKLVYYAANELEKVNPRIIISRAWYKYGPCYEQGRQGEESLTLNMFPNLEPNSEILPEIEKLCEEEIPLFIQSVERSPFYPYEYLKHIYREKADFPELQNFYINKHELAWISHSIASGRVGSEELSSYLSRLDEQMMSFERAILDKKYYKKVEIPENALDIFLDYTALMGYMIREAAEDTNDREKFSIAKNIVKDFIDIVLMYFACKNYRYTFRTKSTRHKENVRGTFERNSTKYLEEIQKKLANYYTQVS
jgi:hypothetical protein